MKPDQTLLNATANSITYTDSGATIQLTNGKTLTADHLLVTVSVGVLQHDEDLAFHPALPDWKREAIDAMKMATYTKIFLKFDNKWWDNTEVCIAKLSCCPLFWFRDTKRADVDGPLC